MAIFKFANCNSHSQRVVLAEAPQPFASQPGWAMFYFLNYYSQNQPRFFAEFKAKMQKRRVQKLLHEDCIPPLPPTESTGMLAPSWILVGF